MNIGMLIISIIMIIVGAVGVWSWLTYKEIPSWISAIGLVIGGPLAMFGVISLISSFVYEQGYYEYKTFSGETGTSRYCHRERGAIICLTDGGVGEITAESYRWIRGDE